MVKRDGLSPTAGDGPTIPVTRDDVLAIIPARGGSKSIPRKNLRDLYGHPLLVWSIAAAAQARRVGRIVVTTDDEEIADVARGAGAEVPFLRPPGLARDETMDLPVFRHALEWLEREEGYRPRIVVQLRPTSPIRPPDCVDEAVRLLAARGDADSVRTVTPPAQNPYKMWRIGDGTIVPLVPSEFEEPYNMPRQALPDTFWQTGHVDAMRRRTILELDSMTGERIAPLVVDPRYAVDIDTLAQWEQAEWLVRNAGFPMVRPFPRDLSRYRVVVFDFDGVMTDNRVHVLEDGRETVSCDRSDGMGIEMLREAGYHVAVLSTETNGVVGARCRKLGIRCIQGLSDKAGAMRALAAELDLPLESMVYVGNDRNDRECLRLAGLPVAVADAHAAARREARWILTRPGGRGAVRELCDHLLEARGEDEHADADESGPDRRSLGG